MDHILISSTEELSAEDRLLLASSKRQEPQGEEHAGSGEKDAHNNSGQALTRTKNISNKQQQQLASSSSSSCEDDSSDEDDDGIVYQNVGMMASAASNSNSLSSNRSHGGRSGGGGCNLSLDSNSHSAYNTLIIHHNNGSLLADTWIPASHEFTSLATGSNRNSTCSSSTPANSRKSQSPSREMGHGHGDSRTTTGQHNPSNSLGVFDYEALLGEAGLKSNELSDIPRDYLNQLTVLKHLAKEVQQDPISDPPNSKLLRSASFSRSQPDLSQSLTSGGGVVGVVPGTSSSHSYYYAPPHPVVQYPHYPAQLHPPSRTKQSKQQRGEANNSPQRSQQGDTDETGVPSTSVQMLEILMRENSNLRAELANARARIQTIHKLESELTRLQRQHASLFESAERRESLERTARVKLSTEVKRLTAVNRELLSSSNSLQNLSSYSLGSDVDIYRKELAKKDVTIAQLISQNKEVTATKDRQEIELAAQRATLEEQRTHIDILDSALTTAQGNVVRLEEECRRNQDYAEKVSQLQRALSSLQVYNEKREQSEKKLRSQQESEITDLKLQLASKNAKSNLNNTRANNNNNGSNNANHANINSNSNNAPSQIMTTNSRTAPPPYPGPNSGSNSASNSNQNLHLHLSNQALHQTAASDIAPDLQCLQEKLRLSEDKIASLTSVVQRWEHFFSLESQHPEKTPTPSGTTPNTPNSWSSRGGTPHFNFGGGGGGNCGTSSGCSSNGALDDLPSTQHRACDLEWKIKDLESRLVEKDNMLRALNTMNVQQQGQQQGQGYNIYSTPAYSPYVPTGFRESPSYTAASMMHQHQKSQQQQQQVNHQVSVSLASMMDRSRSYGVGVDPLLFYEKVGKCDSEPPSYANLPPKLRLGGSGSSLAKNSNESLGSAGHGMSNNASEPESVSSSDGGGGGSNPKSIDEQLKELNTQLLSKGAVSSGLKMQSSGLCCIPGFANPSFATRKGKVPQSLLEGVMSANTVTTDANGNNLSTLPTNNNNHPPNSSSILSSPTKKSVLLPPLPRPPLLPSTAHQLKSGTSRTSSGPPFLCDDQDGTDVSGNVLHSNLLSNSVDSVLAESPASFRASKLGGGPNIFTPVAVKGLPPKSPCIAIPLATGSSMIIDSKCRSLERDQKSKSSSSSSNNDNGSSSSSKFTSSYDPASRCKSLDRRELKAAAKEEKKQQQQQQKSAIGSKAAFFGGLLRRSPSPNRKNKDSNSSDKDKDRASPAPSKGGRFTFGRTTNASHNITTSSSRASPSPVVLVPDNTSDAEIDAEFLTHQGRSSQSQRASRVTKWGPGSASGGGNLPSLQEHGSPWVQRRSGGDISASSSRKLSVESIESNNSRRGGSNSGDANDPTKKWGKIVKSPFGLRYTFGAPRS